MLKEESNPGGDPPNTWSYYVEKRLTRYGRWGKKLAFVAYVSSRTMASMVQCILFVLAYKRPENLLCVVSADDAS